VKRLISGPREVNDENLPHRGSISHSMFPLIVRFVLTTTVILAAPCLSRSDPVAANPPKDAELVASFRSHRDAFEKLASMGGEDANTTSYLNLETLNEEPLTDGRQALGPARRSEYKQLIADIRPDLAVWLDWYRVTFSYWRGGDWLPIGRSWMKGIAYLPHGYERVGTIVPNSDKVPPEDGIYLVPIEPKWYIIYLQLD
jgi:hypothetical protein